MTEKSPHPSAKNSPARLTRRGWFMLGGGVLLLAAIVIVALAASGRLSPDTQEGGPQTAVADTPINLVWFYRPPVDGNPQTLVDHFDSFILTRWGTDEALRDTILASRGDVPMLQYLHIRSIHDPCQQVLNPPGTACACDELTWTNNVGFRPEDICELRDNHPDWFLRDSNGEIIFHPAINEAMMDIGNPGWQQFWLERAIEMQEEYGWQGVFLDNVMASLSGHQRRAETLANYPDNETYQAAMEGFLRYIYTEYFQPQGIPLYGNITEARDSAVWFRYLQYLDGIMNESWAVDWENRYRSPERWEEDMRLAEEVQAQGKHIILISQGQEDDIQRQQFAFASYLLVNNGRASFRYTFSSMYNQPWVYDNYNVNLGPALGPRYAVGNLWRRDFTNGSVVVDPVQHTGVIVSNPPGS